MKLLFKTLVFGSLIFVTSCQCQTSKVKSQLLAKMSWDQSLYEESISELTKSEHPFGSSTQKNMGEYIRSKAESLGWFSFLQEFTAETPNPQAMDLNAPVAYTLKKNGYNVVAIHPDSKNKPCLNIFSSHYDTKIISEGEYFGANDSGSSSVLLLLLAKNLMQNRQSVLQSKCGWAFVWFDGEESILPNWNDGLTRHPAKIVDNTYGSRYFVSALTPCAGGMCFNNSFFESAVPLTRQVNFDMVGSPNLKISAEKYSDGSLFKILEKSLKEMGEYQRLKFPKKYIEDDHVPFLKAGIPALNVIDFENLNHWHRPSDRPERLDPESVKLAQKLALNLFSHLSEL